MTHNSLLWLSPGTSLSFPQTQETNYLQPPFKPAGDRFTPVKRSQVEYFFNKKTKMVQCGQEMCTVSVCSHATQAVHQYNLAD